ncbi:hypothetical protein PIB30_061501 [Stylosanthes scabra]|uniref:Uncharacterized protein n=1 Tax=Stylosanthes scabra TaxID=79078 RepID=A0ABU6SL06_9FABA|nr:hypothetical protein [Stylosanthes scabra]
MVNERPKPEGDLQQVQVGQHSEQVTMIAKNLSEELKEKLTQFLKMNSDLFAWTATDMLIRAVLGVANKISSGFPCVRLTLSGETLASTEDANPRINSRVTHEATLYQSVEWVDQHRSISPRVLIFQSNGPRSLEHG